MTAPDTAPRQALELVEALQRSAESAAAARLEQMHGHLSVGHKASGYDGTAAQIHAQYAQALAPIVEALRAQAEVEAKRAELLSLAVITFHRILKADDQGECCEIANWFLTTRAPALKAVGQPTYNRAALAQAGGEG